MTRWCGAARGRDVVIALLGGAIASAFAVSGFLKVSGDTAEAATLVSGTLDVDGATGRTVVTALGAAELTFAALFAAGVSPPGCMLVGSAWFAALSVFLVAAWRTGLGDAPCGCGAGDASVAGALAKCAVAALVAAVASVRCVGVGEVAASAKRALAVCGVSIAAGALTLPWAFDDDVAVDVAPLAERAGARSAVVVLRCTGLGGREIESVVGSCACIATSHAGGAVAPHGPPFVLLVHETGRERNPATWGFVDIRLRGTDGVRTIRQQVW